MSEDSAKTVLEQLRKVAEKEVLREELGPSLARTLTGIRYHGLLQFYGSVACMAVGATVVGAWLLVREVRMDRSLQESRTLLANRYEPRMSDDRGHVTAALLGDLNSEDGRVAGHPWPEADIWLRQAAASIGKTWDVPDPTPYAWQRCYPPLPTDPVVDLDPRNALFPWPLTPFGSRIDLAREHGFDHGPVWCRHRDEQAVRPTVGWTGPYYDHDSPSVLRVPRLWNVAFDVLKSGDGVGLPPDSAGNLLEKATPGARRAVAGYFVTPDGTFVGTSRGPAGDTSDLDLRKPLRPPQAAAYVQAFLDGDEHGWDGTPDTHQSQVYLDWWGYGLVRTFCRAVLDTRERVTPGVRGPLLGVLCIDEQVQLPSQPSASGYLRVVEGEADGATHLLGPSIEVFIFDEDESGGVPASVARSHPKWMEGGKLRLAESADPGAASRGVRDVLPAADGDSTPVAYLLRAGRTEAGSHARFALLIPRAPIPDGGWLAIGVGFAALAVALLVSGARVAGRARAVTEQTHLLQTLQVGVIQVDDRGLVLAGNQRAEELLRRSLNSFGRVRSNPAFLFYLGDVLDHTVVPIDLEDGSPQTKRNWDRVKLSWEPGVELLKVPLARSRTQRRQGLTPRFYARHQETREWLKIVVKGDADLPGTVDHAIHAVIDIAPPLIKKALDGQRAHEGSAEDDVLEEAKDLLAAFGSRA